MGTQLMIMWKEFNVVFVGNGAVFIIGTDEGDIINIAPLDPGLHGTEAYGINMSSFSSLSENSLKMPSMVFSLWSHLEECMFASFPCRALSLLALYRWCLPHLNQWWKEAHCLHCKSTWIPSTESSIEHPFTEIYFMDVTVWKEYNGLTTGSYVEPTD